MKRKRKDDGEKQKTIDANEIEQSRASHPRLNSLSEKVKQTHMGIESAHAPNTGVQVPGLSPSAPLRATAPRLTPIVGRKGRVPVLSVQAEGAGPIEIHIFGKMQR